MELILTSFGVSHLHLLPPPNRRQDTPAALYRMPPSSLSIYDDGFMPDYMVLLLCERIILDAESFERISTNIYFRGYHKIAEVIKVLHDEGFVRVMDFDTIVYDNRTLLERMLERDLKRLDDWLQPLKESLETWQNFVQSKPRWDDVITGREEAPTNDRMRISALLDLPGCVDVSKLHLFHEAMGSSKKRQRAKYRAALREVLAEYMAYVNANLVLSCTLNAGFHDWDNFAPFYRDKFLTIGQEGTPEQKRTEKVKQLFEISFPEFTFWDVKSVIKALTDKRIFELRDLVDKAVKEKIEFDREFANRTLQEVLGIERQLVRLRNIVSYATLPIGFIPWVGTPAQKGIEELISRLAGGKSKKEFRWFYLISELAQNHRKSPQGLHY